MGTVSSSSHLGGSVGLGMGDGDVLKVEALGLYKEKRAELLLETAATLHNNNKTQRSAHSLEPPILPNASVAYLSVSLDVSQKVQEGLGGLRGEAHLVTGNLVLLGNGVSAHTSSVLGHGDTLLLHQDILKVALGLHHVSALDGSTDLSAVLVMHSQMRHTGLGGCVRKKSNRQR